MEGKMEKNPFDTRRQEDPQGVIDDLLKQTSKQAKRIHDLSEEVKGLRKENEKLLKKQK
jgi:hypothetical protein